MRHSGFRIGAKHPRDLGRHGCGSSQVIQLLRLFYLLPKERREPEGARAACDIRGSADIPYIFPQTPWPDCSGVATRGVPTPGRFDARLILAPSKCGAVLDMGNHA